MAPDAGDQLRARQVEVLYDQLPVALAASIAAGLILASILWSVTPASALFTWLALLAGLTTLRGFLVHRYRHSGDQQAARWLRWFVAGTVSSGILWDTAIIFLTPHDSTLHIGVAVLWVCGLTAGSVASLAAIRFVFFSYSIPALVPGAIYLLTTGGRIETTVGGAVFLFIGFLTLNAMRMHGTIRQSLLLQFENRDLIAHLDAEKARIEKLNEQLEKRVAERTAEISAANAAKSRFLVSASHDLRQPLQTISLLTSILNKTVHEPDQARTVGELLDTTRVMGSLLNTLLDVSKLDSGTIVPDTRDFQVAELLDRLHSDFANHASDGRIRLRVVPCSAVIHSDPVLLEHIVRNLVDNAIRHTQSGKVLLGCRRRGTQLRIEVHDTGAGIPHDQIENIFEEFYQLDNPARDRSKGWGLGLAIVRRSARLLGHKVDVHSIPGRGSTFAVEVPLGTSPVLPAQTPDRQIAVGNDHAAADIFLIEDETAVREAMRSMLELYEFRVNAAADGVEASRRIRALERTPDLIIADYRLPPGSTGIEAVINIRQLMDRDIPGIILTGDISPEIEQQARTHHLDVVHKPVDPNELLALINSRIAVARQQGPGRAGPD